MTAVRLRGTDYLDRAIEAHQRHIDGESFYDLAEAYDAHYDVVRRWVKEGRKHFHPPLTDRLAHLQSLSDELLSRIPDAEDVDAVRLAKQVGEWLGLSHADRQKDAELAMERERLDMLKEMAERLGVARDPAVVKVLTQ